MYILIFKRGGMKKHSPVVDYDPKQTNMSNLNFLLIPYSSIFTVNKVVPQ